MIFGFSLYAVSLQVTLVVYFRREFSKLKRIEATKR